MRTLTILFALVALTGCGSSGKIAFDDLDVVEVEDQVVELSLGYFVIPIPIADLDDSVEIASRNRMQIEFALYAEVPSHFEKRARSAAARNEGRLRDSVITICRTAPMEDLNERSLTALKGHLLDTASPLLDGVPIEELRIVDRQTKPL